MGPRTRRNVGSAMTSVPHCIMSSGSFFAVSAATSGARRKTRSGLRFEKSSNRELTHGTKERSM